MQFSQSKFSSVWLREIAKWLQVLIALIRDLDLISSTQMAAHKPSVILVTEDLASSSGLYGY